jgi:predicted permease
VDFARLLLPDFAVIACGFLVCRYTALGRELWEQVERLVFYLLFPVLLFTSIVRNPLNLGEASGLMAAGVLLGLCGIGLAFVLPRLPVLGRHIDAKAHAGAAQVSFRFNSYVALAVVERLAGPTGLQLLAVLIGACVPLLNAAAVWPMARHGQTGYLRLLATHPLILATVAALAANFAGFHFPAWLQPSVERVGASAIPLGLLAAGAGMRLGSVAQQKVLSTSVLTIKHVLQPLIAWALIRLLGLDATQATVLLLYAALPTAANCYVIASRMGYDGGYVAGLVTLSTLLAIGSLTFAIGVLR